VAALTNQQDGAQRAASPYTEVDRLVAVIRAAGHEISDADVDKLCEDGPEEATDRVRGMAKALGVEVSAPSTGTGAPAPVTPPIQQPQQRKQKTDTGSEQSPPSNAPYRPGRRERREFFQVSNKFFDWQLKMPPVYRLVWADLHRHANGREGRQAKVTTGHIARDCHVHKVAVGQAIKYLHHVGAVVVLAEPKKVPDGSGKVKWSKARIYVPPVTTLDPDELRRRIDEAPKELLRLRPDERRNRLATLQ
jgi:hypothetical protein